MKKNLSSSFEPSSPTRRTSPRCSPPVRKLKVKSCRTFSSGGMFNTGLLASLLPSMYSSSSAARAPWPALYTSAVALIGRPATGTAASISTFCTATLGFGLRKQSTAMMGISNSFCSSGERTGAAPPCAGVVHGLLLQALPGVGLEIADDVDFLVGRIGLGQQLAGFEHPARPRRPFRSSPCTG